MRNKYFLFQVSQLLKTTTVDIFNTCVIYSIYRITTWIKFVFLYQIQEYFLISFLIGCSDNKIYKQENYIFGTIIGIKIYGESKINAEKVSNKIFNEFQRLHDLLHPWEKSIITDINRSYNSSLNSKYKVRVFKETMERVKNYFR